MKENKTINLIIRILVFPFILCLILIKYNFTAINFAILFLRYGGECIVFSDGDRATVQKIYEKLKSEHK